MLVLHIVFSTKGRVPFIGAEQKRQPSRRDKGGQPRVSTLGIG
jgi:hypothetical protein